MVKLKILHEVRYVAKFGVAILLLLTICSCEENTSTNTEDPANLTVDVTVADDRSGEVDVVAIAENTVEYHFYTGTNGTGEPFINSDGNFSFTYTRFGIYTIEIRAYGSSGRFVKKTQQINVEVGNPVDPEDGYITPPSYEGMTLVWHDEFDGNSLNLSDWTFETGTGGNGWGNNELQYYRQENTSVGGGILTIEAREESFGGRNYTSSRIITKDKQEFQYGRVDIRAVLPKGQGLWPALWMLGENISTVGWPACGEIDIMEMIGGTGKDNEVHGTVHWDNNGSYANYGRGKKLASGIFADEYHVFSMVWNETQIIWYLDDVQFNVIDITPAALSEFKNEFFFIFNVAVGGNWPGSPNSSTVFPQKMMVDYVRVFQDN